MQINVIFFFSSAHVVNIFLRSLSTMTLQTPATTSLVKGALLGVALGDALGVSLHWYYSEDVLKEHIANYFCDDKQKKRITELHAPNLTLLHPDSMRAFAGIKVQECASMILPEKLEWFKKPNAHYHATLKKGQNTVPALLAQALTECLVEHGGTYKQLEFVNKYMHFFTFPGANPDLYLGGLHRHFVTNYLMGKPLQECAFTAGHACATDTVTIVPMLLMHAMQPNKREQLAQDIRTQTVLTMNVEEAVQQNMVFATLFDELINQKKGKEALKKAFCAISTHAENLDLFCAQDDTEDMIRNCFQVCARSI